VSDLLDDVAFVTAHRGDAGLDLTYAHLVEQPGYADLLLVGEDHPGRLLAVTQCRVVDVDLLLAQLTVDRQVVDDGVLHAFKPPVGPVCPPVRVTAAHARQRRAEPGKCTV
jgi:hypothetical protein